MNHLNPKSSENKKVSKKKKETESADSNKAGKKSKLKVVNLDEEDPLDKALKKISELNKRFTTEDPRFSDD